MFACSFPLDIQQTLSIERPRMSIETVVFSAKSSVNFSVIVDKTGSTKNNKLLLYSQLRLFHMRVIRILVYFVSI